MAEKIAQLQRQYGLKEIIFVGDRGMITKAVANKIKGTEGLHTISALTHRQIVELLERKVITAELFDEEKIVEVFDEIHTDQSAFSRLQRLLRMIAAEGELTSGRPERSTIYVQFYPRFKASKWTLSTI